MDQEKIGAFIRDIRKEKGLTQEQFAEKLGVSQRSVSRWETGKTMPDYSLLPGICEVLEINVAELLGAERIEGENVPKDRVNDMAQIMIALVNDKKMRRKLLGAILSAIITIVCAVLLYRGEFHVKVDSSDDLERAIDNYAFSADNPFLHGKASPVVLKRQAVGGRLYILYSTKEYPDACGLACLEKGLFGKYRFCWCKASDERWIQCDILTAGKTRYLVTYCAASFPELDSYGFYEYDRDGFRGPDPLIKLPYEGSPFLTFTEIPDGVHLSSETGYFLESGEIPLEELRTVLGNDHAAGAPSHTTSTGEPGLIYVWIGIVILTGIAVTRFFLDDIVKKKKGKKEPSEI